ncbi:hypothetical protein TIFTF001_031919 [Ficus carica]|uniref:Uncharacterized protein n=1 Tax=Ficus carica TaxID=3494 RepID=A0AA88DXG1_FICCA|nr:hypothetical protein TIFTF001_031919 [Ficus carica]
MGSTSLPTPHTAPHLMHEKWACFVREKQVEEREDNHLPERLQPRRWLMRWRTGKNATDSSTWAPVWRRKRFANRPQDRRDRSAGKAGVNSKPIWVYCITGEREVQAKPKDQTSSVRIELQNPSSNRRSKQPLSIFKYAI